ncbi:MAG: 50S ribosomal protein L25 [Verrucomicrobiota bacterium]
MAQKETLQAEKRDVKGTTASKRLRRHGQVPAVIYGASQREYMIQLNAKTFTEIAKKQSSQNFLVNLEIEGAQEKSKLAFVQEIQRDPLSGGLIHVDFRSVSEDEEIVANVPIRLIGEPIGEKLGGLLEQVLHSIDVSCRPADLPESIEGAVEALNVGDSIKVRELNFPEGTTTKMNGEVLVGVVAATRAAVSEKSGGASDGGEASGESADGEASGDE